MVGITREALETALAHNSGQGRQTGVGQHPVLLNTGQITYGSNLTTLCISAPHEPYC